MVPCAGGGNGNLVMAGEGALGGTGEEAWKEHRQDFKTEHDNDIRAKVPGTQEVITCK